MNDAMKEVIAEYIAKSFREGGEAAMIAVAHAFREQQRQGREFIHISDILEAVEGMRENIAKRQGMPFGKG